MGRQPKLETVIVNLKADLDVLLEKMRLSILETIYFDIIYNFYTSKKNIITHEYDPPYDHSGILIRTDKSFHFNDYDTIGDFLEEQTGESIPTFISGYGLSYSTYEEYYCNKIEEVYTQVVYEFLSALDVNVLDQMFIESHLHNDYEKAKQSKNLNEMQYLIGEIADYYDFIYKVWDLQEMTMKDIKKESFKLWYSKLSNSVRKQVLEDREIAQQKYEENQIRISKDKREFSVIWDGLSKEYMSVYHEEMPKRIESPQFPEFMKFLKTNGIEGRHFELIALYAPISFSNSVTDKLKRAALK